MRLGSIVTGVVVLAASAAGQTVESRGVRIQVPAGWSVNQQLIAASGPVALTNFGGAYLPGGIVPPGSAEIEITSVPVPANLTEYVRNELRGANPGKMEEVAENGKAGLRTTYTYPISRGATIGNLAVYVPRGTTLYKFYLSYWSGTVNENALAEVLRSVIHEAQLR